MSNEWTMEFALGGEVALAVMKERPADILITDMRMPGLDGSELLAKVREGWPQTTRIVLTGHCEQEVAIRSVNAAHQFLMKPCDPEVLKRAIVRGLRLRSMIGCERLQRLLSRLTHIPSLPSLYTQINSALANQDTSVRDIGDIVARDVAFSIKLLQLVNSAFFGQPRSITSPQDAVVLLGTDLIRVLVLGTEVFSSMQGRASSTEGTLLWEHCLRTGILARNLALEMHLDASDAATAFLAGFIHNAGRIVLWQNLPDDMQRCLDLIASGVPRLEAEERVFGVPHEVVAAALLSTWGLPDASTEAVAFMHRPSESPSQVKGPLTAAHIADAFDEEMHGDGAGKGGLDEAYVARLGLSDQIARWRSELQNLAKATGAIP